MITYGEDVMYKVLLVGIAGFALSGCLNPMEPRMTSHLIKPIRAIHFLVLAFLMTIGTQVSAKSVGREASIDILSKGQILVTRTNEYDGAEYHVIYKNEFYWCTSFLIDREAKVYCYDCLGSCAR